MDGSLAKGHKNQFFRDIGEGVDKATELFSRITRATRLGNCKRSVWDRYVATVTQELGPYLIHSCTVGSKRQPKLCLYLFEEQNDRGFNSWQEKCVSSAALVVSPSPHWMETRNIGFNVSEHAVQRLFERALSEDVALTHEQKITLLTGELRYAPLMSAFWTALFLQAKERKTERDLEIMIPAPSGMLAGTLTKETFTRCEIRTFLSIEMLKPTQRALREQMVAFSERHVASAMPFYLLSVVGDIPFDEAYFQGFMAEAFELQAAIEESKHL